MTAKQAFDIICHVILIEKMDFGGGRTKGQMQAQWARCIGIVHHGHPIYNQNPDPQWCLKDAGGGRPTSEDTFASRVTREGFDCIPRAGAGTYDPEDRHEGWRLQFGELGVLPSIQNIFPPPKPNDSGTAPAPPPVPVPPAHVCPPCQTLGTAEALTTLDWLHAYYKSREGLQRPNGLSLNGEPDFLGIAAWYCEVYERERITFGRSIEDARATVVKMIRRTHEWGIVHPGETP